MVLKFEIFNICENIMDDFDKVVKLIDLGNLDSKLKKNAFDKAIRLIKKNDFDKSDFEHRISKRDLNLIFSEIDTLEYDN